MYFRKKNKKQKGGIFKGKKDKEVERLKGKKDRGGTLSNAISKKSIKRV